MNLSKIAKTIQRLAQSAISEKYYPRIFVATIVVCTIILTAMNLNGSSINIFHRYFYKETTIDANLLFGEPRGIRTDEFKVATPLALAQVRNNFQYFNDSVNAGQDLSVLYDAPTNHWSTIFRIYNWGFFFLPESYAFAFKWWVRGALLVISSFLFIKKITKSNFLASFGSISLLFSPLIQWWYSVFVVDGITYLFFSLYFLLKQSESNERIDLFRYTGLFLLSVLLLFFIVYPPYIIGYLYVIFVVFIGFYLNDKSTPKRNLILTILSLGISSLVFGIFLYEKQEIVHIISSTVYPGARITEGGGYSFYKIPYYFYNILSVLHPGELPLELHNLSEASGIIPLYIISLPISIFHTIIKIRKKKKIDYLSILLSSLYVLLLVWILLGIPGQIASIMLLDKIPLNRAIHILSTINFMGMFYFISTKEDADQKTEYKIFAYIYTSVITFFLILYGHSLGKLAPEFLTSLEFFGITIASWLLILTYTLKKRILFILFLFLFSFFSTYKVNPLYRGTNALTDAEPIKEIQSVAELSQESKWIVFNDSTLSSILIANGIPSISGLQLYPNFDLWNTLDPEGYYFDNYNRYGHVIFSTIESEEVIVISNPTAHLIEVQTSPCNKNFSSLDVKYFVFMQNVDESYDCIVPVKTISSADKLLFIYEIND